MVTLFASTSNCVSNAGQLAANCRAASASRPASANWNDESIRSVASLSRNMAWTLS